MRTKRTPLKGLYCVQVKKRKIECSDILLSGYSGSNVPHRTYLPNTNALTICSKRCHGRKKRKRTISGQGYGKDIHTLEIRWNRCPNFSSYTRRQGSSTHLEQPQIRMLKLKVRGCKVLGMPKDRGQDGGCGTTRLLYLVKTLFVDCKIQLFCTAVVWHVIGYRWKPRPWRSSSGIWWLPMYNLYFFIYFRSYSSPLLCLF